MSEKFEYKYSAPTQKERKEIDSIRSQYLAKSKEESKLDRLRYLDSKVKSYSTIVGLTLGIIGTLVFGLGLTFILEWDMFTRGAILMLVGVGPIIIAYYAYKFVLNKMKAKYGEEIIELSNELLSEDE